MDKTTDDVEVVDRERPHDGYFKIDRYRLRHRKFEGGWTEVMTRENFERGHAAAVLLYDPDRETLVFVEQFRVGAYAAITNSPWFDDDASPWLIEPVAGIIEDGETPDEVVMREAVEEADCHILDLLPVAHYLVSPGGTSESLFVFCGRVDSSEAHGGVHGLEHEHEDIRVMVVDVQEAFDMLDQGRIVNAMALIPLMWFRMNHEQVRRHWLG